MAAMAGTTIAAIAATTVLKGSVHAAEDPPVPADIRAAAPTDAPMGAQVRGFDRMTRFFQNETNERRIPGAVVMIARHGQVVYNEAFGLADPATGAPMRTDSIFRIYPMTKPVTGVAVLMLMEQGRIRLSDPVSKYLPAMKHMLVVEETVDAEQRPVVSIVPATREITIEDLLTHTSGITYGSGSSPAEQAMRQAGLGIQLGRGNGQPLSQRLTDQQVVEALGRLPLKFQPGTAWVYGRSTDVLLALVEVVSGERGDVFMRDHIFRPLGMTDTFFNVPPDKLDRVAQPGPDPETGKTPDLTDVTRRRIFLGGGEGLLSTAADYMRFARMLAHGGELEGVRLLSPRTVALMTTDHLAPRRIPVTDDNLGTDDGFGLTVAVRTRSNALGHAGEFGWEGVAGTAFWVDPGDELVSILMIQAPGQGYRERSALRSLVYQALADTRSALPPVQAPAATGQGP
jgi:CubicO group peptidase (beta-lactamase class C family)